MPEKKKTAVPRLRFPEFRDAGPWEVKRLGEIAESLTSLSGKTSKDFGHGNAFYVPYTNVYENVFVDPNKLERVDIGPNENQNTIRRGDILFTVSSETPDEAGMSSVVVHDISNCYVNSFCAIYRPVSSIQLDLTFAGYYLRSPIVRKHFLKTAQGAIRFNLNREAFQKTPVLLPPPPEQQKIADCLSSLDDLIRAEEAQLAALKEQKKGLMQQLFPAPNETTPRLRFPEFRNAGPWEVKRLGDEDIAQFVRDRIPPDNIPIGHYVSTVNLLPDFGGLAVEPEAPPSNNAVAYREGDILMSNIRPYLKKVWVADKSGGASNDVLVVRAGESVMHAYLGHLLMSDQFIAHVMEGAKGVKMPRGDLEQIQDFRVPVPPDQEEQQKIADCLSSLDDLIRAKAARIDALKTHKRGLMQQLFPSIDGVRG